MKFIDLEAQQARIKKSIEERVRVVLAHGQYVNGPEVSELEVRLASYVGNRNAVGCSSGTDALLMALMAYGVGPGDAVFTTPFTFVATAEVIRLLGAVPVFVDIDPKTFNLDPGKLETAIRAVLANDPALHPLPLISNRLSLKARGVIAVDLFGLPADYDRINPIARNHGLFVIEDAAQSFGAQYNGRKSCSLADIGCTSFFPAKPLGCYGDGGMCFTDDDKLADILRSIRVHGMGEDRYDNVRIGINGRLDTLQAAILLAKFEIFPEEVELRQEKAMAYGDLISSGLSPNPIFSMQHIPAGSRSAWAQYSILAADEQNRETVLNALKEENIPTAIYYPKPLHLQTAFAFVGQRKGDFPISEDYASRIFSVPMHPYLSSANQAHIVEVIRRCCGS
jgi:dTDP-4-amino-4,6-dideoxygalactose transaminase